MTVDIIGIGSPFGNDVIGHRVVAYLQAMPDFRDDRIRVMLLDRPSLSLTHHLAPEGRIVIVDAMVGGASPGAVKAFPLDAMPTGFSPYSSHAFGVADALKLARSLGQLPEKLRLVGVEVPDAMAATDDVDPMLAQQVPEYARFTWEVALGFCD